jgi:acetyl-CoA carboxylase biotin carboxyl carrier protein
VRRVAALAEELGLSELEVQQGERRIRVRRGGEHAAAPRAGATTVPVHTEPAPAAATAAPSLPAGSVLLRAPMAGTFYRAPAPGQPVFVDAGSAVQPETVVCIIESMKMMNRIEAERSGRIASVLVANGARIQIGQPLFALTE